VVASCWSSSGDVESRVLLLLHARTHLKQKKKKKKKKKKLHLYTRMVVITRRFVTERSSMVEDAPTAAEHGRQRHVMGTVRGTVSGEVSFRGIH
jgi:ribosomal protein S18